MNLMKSNKTLEISEQRSQYISLEKQNQSIQIAKQSQQYQTYWPMPYYPYINYPYQETYFNMMPVFGFPGFPIQPYVQIPETMKQKKIPEIIKIQESQEQLVMALQLPELDKNQEKVQENVEEKIEISKNECIDQKNQVQGREDCQHPQEQKRNKGNQGQEESSSSNCSGCQNCSCSSDNNISGSQSNNKQQTFNYKVFQQLLKSYVFKPTYYNKIYIRMTQISKQLTQIAKIFNFKIVSFKKSKQQMIKIIIRKTQRLYKLKNDCKKDQRFKKYGGFKSMNSIYLQKLFSDQDFIACYKQIEEKFIKQFKHQNDLKLATFINKLNQAQSWQDIKIAMRTIQQKNKMPWPRYWIQRFQNVVNQITSVYVERESAKPQAKMKKQHH